MERTKEQGKISKPINTVVSQYLRVGSFATFVVLLAYSSILAYSTGIQDIVYFLVVATVFSHSLGLKLKREDLISTSWILLGLVFISTWIFSSGIVSDLSVFIWVAVLLVAYEFYRFDIAIQKGLQATGLLDVQSAIKYESMIRRHAFDTLLTISVSLIFSIVVASLSEGLSIMVRPPVLGIVIFGFLAVLLIAILTAQASR